MSKKKTAECKCCGSEFEYYPSNSAGDFCSKACWYTWKGIQSKGRYFAIQKLVESVKIPEEEWKHAYLAGIIDGEGSICFRRANGKGNFEGCSPLVSIANTDLKLLDWILQEFSGKYTLNKDPSKNECRLALKDTILKPCFQWRMTSLKDCLKLLTAILPFLIIKQQNAVEIIGYCERAIANHEQKAMNWNNGTLPRTANSGKYKSEIVADILTGARQ